VLQFGFALHAIHGSRLLRASGTDCTAIRISSRKAVRSRTAAILII